MSHVARTLFPMPQEVILTDAELIRVRMRALGLDSARTADAPGLPGPERAAAVVAQLFALQGQAWRSSRWAVGTRAPGLTQADVIAALNSGRIVRSWPMRGTVHLIAAEDIGWVQRLTNPRVVAGAQKRRDFLGMSDAVLEHATEVSLAALAGGASLTRDELAAVWTEAGIDWKPNWRYHLIWWLCQNGLATFGPVPEATDQGPKDPELRLVLAADWIPHPREFTGDAALIELAHRYVRGRGAVTQKDLASWALIPATDAKRGLTLAVESGALVRARRADTGGAAGALFADPAHLGAANEPRDPGDWRLLPAFDEHLLGYALRAPQFDAAHLPQLIPGKNGMFLATVVRDGRAVGTWRRDPKSGDVEVTAFPGERVDPAALEPELARWAAFTGVAPPALTVR